MRAGDEKDGQSGLARREGSGSSEEQELAWKRAERQRLLQQALDLEMQVGALRNSLEAFAHQRLLRLGPLLARRDELRARVAEALADRRPEDPVLQRRAQERRARARQTTEAATSAQDVGPGPAGPVPVPVPRELRREFHRGAQMMHPDLGRTEEERELRHRFMVRLNNAYRMGDLDGVLSVITAWESAAPPDPSKDVRRELARVIRGIAQLRKTIQRLDVELQELRGRPEHALMVEAKRAEAEGRDVFKELEESLQAEIDSLAARLVRIRAGEDE